VLQLALAGLLLDDDLQQDAQGRPRWAKAPLGVEPGDRGQLDRDAGPRTR